MHHANLLVGNSEDAEKYVVSLSKKLGVGVLGNPDFVILRSDTFGIDEAREIKYLSAKKPLGDRQIFLIISERLTLEAQNALLKTFEDPSSETYFFLSVREEGVLIATLRSRMNLVRLKHGSLLQESSAKKFLSLSLKDRLLFAKKFADDELNLSHFLDDLLLILKEKSGDRKSLEKVYNTRLLVRDTSLASRLVLEHLSLVLS